MGLSCGARVLKFCLFVFNLLFLFCGIACLLLGAWLIMDKYALESLASAALKAPGIKDDALMDLASKPAAVRQIGYALLVVGCVVLIVAFLGCCGAAKEWRPLLCCYATLLMAILAIEITAAIYAAMHSHMFQKDFRQLLKASLKMYNGTETLAINDKSNTAQSDDLLVKLAWDKFMIEKKCCGVDSRRGDFAQSGWYQVTGRLHEFPPACCPPRANGNLMPYCPTISRYGEGCLEFMRFEEQLRFSLILGMVALIGTVQLICFAMAVRLFIHVKKELLYLY
ncbi:unnamed protein product [Bursaphelenchus xylophilus]|uniref:Tetraspanin n=1 Tax=Bursaphelenchus xylophilus TaxID=6326 RepID=A0A1I7S9T2_BURXY|nr:unnamed protein product [Bursaphelenchus xylophilus]CAG9129218.1 unnamed protein product [Bursaphelenchus xylophilus]